jgi:hypothetical protein
MTVSIGERNTGESMTQQSIQPSQPQQINVGTVIILPAQDGNGAVLTFNLFGIFEQKIFIPRETVIAFLQAWTKNERIVHDIQGVLAKGNLHA